MAFDSTNVFMYVGIDGLMHQYLRKRCQVPAQPFGHERSGYEALKIADALAVWMEKQDSAH